MQEYKRLIKKATQLIDKLQDDITTGKRQMVENYGQKEIRKFENKELVNVDLTYFEKCNILDILYKVSSIC